MLELNPESQSTLRTRLRSGMTSPRSLRAFAVAFILQLVGDVEVAVSIVLDRRVDAVLSRVCCSLWVSGSAFTLEHVEGSPHQVLGWGGSFGSSISCGSKKPPGAPPGQLIHFVES